jgi:hypothetical protein
MNTHKTHDGFFSFIIMVFIACGVAWWNGWDKMALDYVTGVVKTGTDAKASVMKQVDSVKTIIEKKDAENYKAIGDPALLGE